MPLPLNRYKNHYQHLLDTRSDGEPLGGQTRTCSQDSVAGNHLHEDTIATELHA